MFAKMQTHKNAKENAISSRPSLQTAIQNLDNRNEAKEIRTRSNVTENLDSQPLDQATRRFMESRFRHDFSQVRVDTDARAAESNCRMNSLAYTKGQHVFFAASQYRPLTREGRRLLTHELVHVVQQHRTTQQVRSLTPSQAEIQADLATNRLDSGLLVGPLVLVAT